MSENVSMLQFPPEFFKREERSGHVVGELMKRTWAAELEILAHIDAICKKYDLTYYAYWGTLLGAVRHNGFIPWDDDLDIAMKREDYNKFLEVAWDELPEGYEILNNYFEFWDNSITKVANSKNIDFSERKMKRFHDCPFAVGIDIFPLDYLPRDEQAAAEQKEILEFIGILMTALEERKQSEADGASKEELEEQNMVIAQSLIDLQNACGVQFDGERPILQQLYILYDQVAGMFTAEESDVMTSMFNYIRNGYVVERELLQEVVMVPFETIKMPIPCGYDTILRKTYRDYMIPRKFTSTHGDIYFRDQIEVLARLVDSKVMGRITAQEESEILEYAIKEREENGRKVVLVSNNTLELLVREGQAIEKLRHVLGVFEENQEVLLWWRTSRIDDIPVKDLEKMNPQLVEEYHEMMQEFEQKKLGILDKGVTLQKALELCDAYYGDDNEIAKAFQEKGKPVMIADYRIVG